jgi:urease accessory protein
MRTSAAISTFEPRDDAVAPVQFQRNEGKIRLAFEAKAGGTRLAGNFQRGAMKVRFPNTAGRRVPEAVLINISGGLTGGDSIDMEAAVGEGAEAVVTSQACEKIYRSLGEDAVVSARLRIADCGRLDWLPQPTILFDRARLARTTDVEMAEDATLLAVEAIIFGRTAMAECVVTGALSDRWTIRRGGRLIHWDRFLLDGEIAARLARPSVLAGNHAMATFRYVAPDARARLDGLRDILGDIGGIAAASVWDGMLVVRLVAPGGYRLTQMLISMLERFRAVPLPRAWYI